MDGSGTRRPTASSGPALVVVGLSHKSAPVDVRERAAIGDGELPEVLARAAAAWGDEAMIVSTCNRVELYLADRRGVAPSLRAEVATMLAERTRVEPALVEPHLYALGGEAALRHLFRVAASLDSMVVGEPQILGQVKDAFEHASRAGTIGPVLADVVPRAFAAARRVRAETAIARASTSVASVAVDLGRRIFGDLGAHEVLVIGAGKMGELAARHLVSAGCRRVLVTNRTEERAADLARRLRETGAEVEAHAFGTLPQLLARADLVLSSTGAPQPILTRELVAKAMKARKGRWLYLVDIAVPRDVDPAARELENVYLYDVDALTRIVDQHLHDRGREAERAEAILDEEIERARASWKALGVVPTIRALRDRFADVAAIEAQRTLGRLGDLSDKQRREVQLLAESIVNKLLHAPLTALKREAESETLVLAVHALFELRDVAAAEPRLLGTNEGRKAQVAAAQERQGSAGEAHPAGSPASDDRDRKASP